MLTLAQIKQFQSDGYLIVPKIFSEADMLTCRNIFLSSFNSKLWEIAPNSSPNIINNIYLFFPELINIIFSSKFIEAIKDILGQDAVLIPECSIHRNRFIHWHKDTSIQELEKETSHKDYNFPLIQAAIYFQDNSVHGGGLTVLPGTHMKQDRFKHMLSTTVFNKLFHGILKKMEISAFDKAEMSKEKIDLPTKIGDLLLFDVRIDHRSSLPEKKCLDQNTSKDKLAIFNTFGNDNIVTRKYFDFMKQRTEPYYRYFRDVPLPEVVYKKASELNINIWY
jgi:hypothetical protein